MESRKHFRTLSHEESVPIVIPLIFSPKIGGSSPLLSLPPFQGRAYLTLDRGAHDARNASEQNESSSGSYLLLVVI